jgi:hypothetical protein
MITFSPPEREERGVFSPSESTLLTSIFLHIGEKKCWGSALISMRIRIKGAIPMETHADPDPGQTFKSQKHEILHEKCT